MKDKKSKLIIIIAIFIVIIIGLIVVVKNVGNNGTSNKTNQNVEIEKVRQISIEEELEVEGFVGNLQGVRWNSARIRQDGSKMEISIMLNNESKTEKVPVKKLTVKVLDKDGKVIASKSDVEMKEIPDNFGYTTLDLKFDVKDIVVVYDIQISAN